MTIDPYTVKVVMKHPNVVISHVHLESGHATPKHSHRHDYVVHPKQDTKLLKTTYRNGVVVSEEHVEHKAGEPYYVSRSEDGTEFTIKNLGNAAMMCEKTQLPPKS